MCARDSARSRRGCLDPVSICWKKVWKDPVASPGCTTRQFLQFWELTPTRLATDDPELAVRPCKRRTTHGSRPRRCSRRDREDPVSLIAPFDLEFALALVGLVLLGESRPSAAVLITGVTLAFAFG